MNKKQIKDYQQYIQCICAVDIEAAEYIYEYFKAHPEVSCGLQNLTLNNMFIWNETPQGSEYWVDIATKAYKMQNGE